uniref:Uncharacterized protein n=1 Tax=Myotis myotis TaxID=51298 RepID=A0A7J7UDC1_MYOMY|nr:hypothetical protein mMyoMyo1_008806 [Myotis myotis]
MQRCRAPRAALDARWAMSRATCGCARSRGGAGCRRQGVPAAPHSSVRPGLLPSAVTSRGRTRVRGCATGWRGMASFAGRKRRQSEVGQVRKGDRTAPDDGYHGLWALQTSWELESWPLLLGPLSSGLFLFYFLKYICIDFRKEGKERETSMMRENH